jgi:hypothetical protein
MHIQQPEFPSTELSAPQPVENVISEKTIVSNMEMIAPKNVSKLSRYVPFMYFHFFGLYFSYGELFLSLTCIYLYIYMYVYIYIYIYTYVYILLSMEVNIIYLTKHHLLSKNHLMN